MEELLLTYNERPFVSASYRTGLDGIGTRAEQMAADVPADLKPLFATLGQDNVRRLSVTLLIDLLRLERDAARAPELARDVAALAEDLLLAGDYESALGVVKALQEQAANPKAVSSQACRVALDALVATAAFHETSDLLGGMSDDERALFAEISATIGPAATDALKKHLEEEPLTPGRARATTIIRGYGPRAVTRLASLVGSNNWAARRNAADLLGEIGGAEAIALLQPLLRGQDGRVTTAAVGALAGIKDPAAGRAVHTALRAATGEQRRAVVEALVNQRDARVVPVLIRILEESDPFGGDHAIVLDTLGALTRVGDDQAVPALSTLLKKKKFFATRKMRAIREKGLSVLRGLETPAARRAIEDAAATGDRMLRRLARAGA
jgi:HEAT repeat protein